MQLLTMLMVSIPVLGGLTVDKLGCGGKPNQILVTGPHCLALCSTLGKPCVNQPEEDDDDDERCICKPGYAMDLVSRLEAQQSLYTFVLITSRETTAFPKRPRNVKRYTMRQWQRLLRSVL